MNAEDIRHIFPDLSRPLNIAEVGIQLVRSARQGRRHNGRRAVAHMRAAGLAYGFYRAVHKIGISSAVRMCVDKTR